MGVSVIMLIIELSLIIQLASIIIFVIFLWKLLNSKPARRKVYMINHTCYKPKKLQQRTREQTVALIIAHGESKLKDDALKFLSTGVMASGIGDSTHVPEQLLMDPPDLSLNGAIKEAEAAMFGAVDALLAETGVMVDDVGVLAVNCSLFNPVPSLSSMIVNRYKLKNSVKNFDLSGMGCSASLVAIGLAKNLLQVHENTCAMVVSIEVISQNIYKGEDHAKLATNCVFRIGGAAILLSNKSSDKHTSKYQLLHTVHTNTAKSNTSHKCIYQEEDKQGLMGVTISKHLLIEAKNAINSHLLTLCWIVLPICLKFRLILSKLIKKPYFLNLNSVFDHCFPHVGGTMVIDEFERSVKLDVEAARMTLYRFGNTSSSSVWYEMAYAEAKRRVKRGDRVWQIAYGSGFKCSSVIWRAMKGVNQENCNPWNEEIDDYPINLDFKASPFVFEQPK